MKTIEEMILDEIARQTGFDPAEISPLRVFNTGYEVGYVNVKDLAKAIRKGVVSQMETSLGQLGKALK